MQDRFTKTTPWIPNFIVVLAENGACGKVLPATVHNQFHVSDCIALQIICTFATTAGHFIIMGDLLHFDERVLDSCGCSSTHDTDL